MSEYVCARSIAHALIFIFKFIFHAVSESCSDVAGVRRRRSWGSSPVDVLYRPNSE